MTRHDPIKPYREHSMKLAAERRQKMVELYELGLSTADIANKLDIHERTVQRGLQREGIAAVQFHCPRFTDEERIQAELLLNDGASYTQVAATLGRDFKTVYRNVPGYAKLTKEEIAQNAALGRALRRL